MTKKKGKGKIVEFLKRFFRIGTTETEERNEEIHIGYYVFSVETDENGSCITVRDVGDQWSIKWTDRHFMYAILVRWIADGKCNDYIESLMRMMMIAISYPHDAVAIGEKQDAPFLKGFVKLWKKQIAFEASVAKKPTKKEDEEALEETVQLREIEEELEALDEDEVHRGRT